MQSVLRKMLLGMAVAVFAASMSSVSAQSKNPGMGTWKLNLEKSKYSPGPPPKSLTVALEPAGKGVATHKRVVAKDGKSWTVAIKGVNPKGEPFDNFLVFDKQ